MFTVNSKVARFALRAVPVYPAWVIIGQADTGAQAAAQPQGAPVFQGGLWQPRLRWALLAALGGGLALAAAFPPFGIWPLAAAGPALLVVALSGRTLRGAFAVGMVFGAAFFVPLLSWVVNLAWYAWLALALADTVIFAVLVLAQRPLFRLPCWPIAVAGWWVATEAVRDRWPFGGFPWGRLAMSQATAPDRGWAAIGGAPLLSFAVALAGAVFGWLLLVALTPERRASRRGLAGAAGLFVGAAAIVCLPALLPLDPVPTGSKTAEVAAIQGDVPRARTLAEQLNAWMVTLNHVAATDKLASAAAAGKEPRPDLVIWPENSTDIDPSRYPPVYAQIASAAAAIGRPILVGAVLQDPLRNAGLLWLPDKGPAAMYVKRQLVPFGEVIPFRSLLSKITSLTSLQPHDFTAGHSSYVFTIGQIKLGDVICYEIGFDNLVRSEVTAGANLLTMQTNDATFERGGQTGETGQQLAMARIRAVEHDRAVIVASTTGYSAIVAPDGNLIASSGTWQQTELEARVPLLTSTTLADRVGAWPEWAIVALTILAFGYAAGGALRERRQRRAAPASSADSAAGPEDAG
jgi:apolipoprotein N-acyltransferase